MCPTAQFTITLKTVNYFMRIRKIRHYTKRGRNNVMNAMEILFWWLLMLAVGMVLHLSGGLGKFAW